MAKSSMNKLGEAVGRTQAQAGGRESEITSSQGLGLSSVRMQNLSPHPGCRHRAVAGGFTALTFFSSSWTLWLLSSEDRLSFWFSDSVLGSDSWSSPEDVSFSLIFVANLNDLLLTFSSVMSVPVWGCRASLLSSVSDKSPDT